jgi:hypothetical protein
VPVTLVFEKAGSIDVELAVVAIGARRRHQNISNSCQWTPRRFLLNSLHVMCSGELSMQEEPGGLREEEPCHQPAYRVGRIGGGVVAAASATGCGR